ETAAGVGPVNSPDFPNYIETAEPADNHPDLAHTRSWLEAVIPEGGVAAFRLRAEVSRAAGGAGSAPAAALIGTARGDACGDEGDDGRRQHRGAEALDVQPVVERVGDLARQQQHQRVDNDEEQPEGDDVLREGEYLDDRADDHVHESDHERDHRDDD